MADSRIQVGNTSDYLQSFLNTIGANEVHSEAVTPTDENGVPYDASNPFQVAGPLTDAELRAADVTITLDGEQVSVSNFPSEYALPAAQLTTLTPQTDSLTDAELRASNVGVDVSEAGITPKSATATTSGTTTIVTPSSGKAIRLYWFELSARSTNSAAVVAGLRWTTGGADFFQDDFSQYGGKVSHSYKGGRSYTQGGADEALVINLSASQTVYVNIDYEEVTP